MATYIPDSKTQRWVIIAEARTNRPTDTKDTSKSEIPTSVGTKVCPFCPGNEHMTPPEVYRIGTGGKGEAGWQVRVVPNKFPITDIHEVFIHSTDHTHEISELSREQATQIVKAYRDRYIAHAGDGHIIIFCNNGKTAGASLAHPHSQLVVVAKQITLDSLSREPVQHMIESKDGYISYCPDFSQWPYEIWIAPESESTNFGAVTDAELPHIADALQRSLRRLRTIHDIREEHKTPEQRDPFVYNYYVSHGEHWFIRVIPRFIHRAGFELGTGLSVNTVSPKVAASELLLADIT